MKRLIQITISIILISVLIYFIDIEQVKKSLINARYEFLILTFIVLTFNRFIMGYKWNLLLKIKNIHISTFEATKIYYISNFIGLFLPPTIGGDIVRAYRISKKNHAMYDILASIVIERILGFIALFISAIIGFLLLRFTFINLNFDGTKMLMFMLLLTAAGIILFILSLNKRFKLILKNIFSRFKHNKLITKIINTSGKIFESYQGYKHHKGTLVIFLLLTFAEIFTVILWTYVTSMALNVNVDFLYFTAFMPVALIFMRIPISLDGFGIYEGVFIFFLLQVGISESLGFSVGFINHLMILIALLPGALFYSFDKQRDKQADMLIDNKSIKKVNL